MTTPKDDREPTDFPSMWNIIMEAASAFVWMWIILSAVVGAGAAVLLVIALVALLTGGL